MLHSYKIYRFDPALFGGGFVGVDSRAALALIVKVRVIKNVANNYLYCSSS